MPGQWKEVVRLTFKGDRFRDHALDLIRGKVVRRLPPIEAVRVAGVHIDQVKLSRSLEDSLWDSIPTRNLR